MSSDRNAYERWQMGDPAKVLERRGEDCTHCRHLAKYRIADQLVTVCENPKAPAGLHKGAPAKRCAEWRHEKQDGGQ